MSEREKEYIKYLESAVESYPNDYLKNYVEQEKQNPKLHACVYLRKKLEVHILELRKRENAVLGATS